jgi:hypothetical protein
VGLNDVTALFVASGDEVCRGLPRCAWTGRRSTDRTLNLVAMGVSAWFAMGLLPLLRTEPLKSAASSQQPACRREVYVPHERPRGYLQ